jgi:two-component system cell cycle response regulator
MSRSSNKNQTGREFFSQPPQDSTRKALLIENSPLYHKFLSEQFSQLGYKPIIADSGLSALEQFHNSSFQVVCMNMYFEGGNAIDFVKMIRRHDPSVVVIMLTSDKSRNLRTHALRAGVTEVIYKTGHKDISRQISSCLKHDQHSRLQGSKVMYVEDSMTQAIINIRTLENMGLEVTHYRTAEAAMEDINHTDFDLVITDVLLKGEASGLTLLRHIRSLPSPGKRIPVLTITGYDDTARRQELFRVGTSDYIAKPVLQEELIIRVTNLISNKLLADKVAGQQAQLYDMAVRDHLTGCYNRHGFSELASIYLKQIETKPDSVSFLLLDLDYFKNVNDSHGHDIGDQVLSAIGNLLVSECRSDDLVARYGGEEFVILLPHCKKKAAMGIAQRLCEKVESLRPAGIHITTSIGVTQAPKTAVPNLDKLFKAADQGVYHAKSQGRNCISYRPYPKNKGSDAE